MEEELRADIEEKQHVIEALQTKVSLLKSGGKNVIDDSQKNDSLVDVSDTGIDTSIIKPDADKVATLEGMILSLKFRYSEKARKIWPIFHFYFDAIK